jgi:hypothetical protein
MFGHDSQQNNNQHDDAQASSTFSPSTDAPVAPVEDSHATATELSLPGTPAAATPSSAPSTPVVDDDLLSIKQAALQQLTPLVGHLEQTPEEKFRTTMMMIQAADDQSLIKAAYEAAKEITDEKARAQALLDIVNEINYFTQQQHNS